MILGIDTGGTNVDAVALDATGIHGTAKVPNEETAESVEAVVSALGDEVGSLEVERAVVATTLVVNAAVQGRLPDCTNVVIPGPGLAPERSFFGEENVVAAGAVDHRGRVTEEAAVDAVGESGVTAITGKFSQRNPELERDIRDTLSPAEGSVALGNESGAGLTFPERAATTVANARSKPVFATFSEAVSEGLSAAGIDAPVYYLKGDGSMLGVDAMHATPAHTVRGGSAASSLGLIALTGVTEGIAVDIGGTTTDVTRITGRFPDTEQNVSVGPLEPAYAGVVGRNLPVGGDTRVVVSEGGPTIGEERMGNAVAFGGPEPTLTDALHVLEVFTAGDVEAARKALADVGAADPERASQQVLDAFIERVGEAIASVSIESTETLAVGGVLAPHLAPLLAESTEAVSQYAVPPHADVSGAVGCGVARVSVETALHVDSARGVKTVTSVGPETVSEIEQGKRFTDAKARELAIEEAQAAAERAGGSRNDPAEVLGYDRFSVVERSRVAGQIIHARARVEPAVERVFAGDE
ncbi:MAG: hydantoinase/oxoprolinase family protein [Halodesulfurarchaeum sp.]